MYLSKKPMILNDTMWIVDSRADILLLDITLIKLDNVSYIICWLSIIVGWKCMDSKFQVLSNIYFGAEYRIRFIYLESVIVLFALVIW